VRQQYDDRAPEAQRECDHRGDRQRVERAMVHLRTEERTGDRCCRDDGSRARTNRRDGPLLLGEGVRAQFVAQMLDRVSHGSRRAFEAVADQAALAIIALDCIGELARDLSEGACDRRPLALLYYCFAYLA